MTLAFCIKTTSMRLSAAATAVELGTLQVAKLGPLA